MTSQRKRFWTAWEILAQPALTPHPGGTCRMGINPAGNVVDPECRVHSVVGLRVVDASIMLAIVSGNTTGLPREAPAVWKHPQWATHQR